jgi:uncharacterized protein (DUF1499 family)
MLWGKKIMIFLLVFLLMLAILVFLLSLKLAADSRNMNVELSYQNGRLISCPSSPNCVSSDESIENSHYIEPFNDPGGFRWNGLVESVSSMSGATLVEKNSVYARFTFLTPLIGFMDDVEFHHRPERGEIAVRSASRVGYSDFNANRERIEVIRNVFEKL